MDAAPLAEMLRNQCVVAMEPLVKLAETQWPMAASPLVEHMNALVVRAAEAQSREVSAARAGVASLMAQERAPILAVVPERNANVELLVEVRKLRAQVEALMAPPEDTNQDAYDADWRYDERTNGGYL